MASKRCVQRLSRFTGNNEPQRHFTSVTNCRIQVPRRSMATVSDSEVSQILQQDQQSSNLTLTVDGPSNIPVSSPQILTTVYDFPSLEPLRFQHFSPKHLGLPLRRDLLHRAVIFEGDKTRQGTASTKWRDEVHGSHRKMRPQKGSGRARIGDKQSPSIRGGGVAFGPKPRDFSTKLPRKVYDLAWRIALSYRYRKGELVLVDRIEDPMNCSGPFLRRIFEQNGWGNAAKRSLLVTDKKRDDNEGLFEGMAKIGEQGRLLTTADVDVKDLLELGRIVIEVQALKSILRTHSSDIVPSLKQHNPEILLNSSKITELDVRNI